MSNLVVVADNAPCHSRLANVLDENSGKLLKLGPYSPMLNPCEAIWTKIKSNVKSNIEVPMVTGSQLGEQRLQYLEGLVNNALTTVTVADCIRSVQHTTTFHSQIDLLQDVPVGE